MDTIGYINDDLNLCGSNAALTLANHGVNWGYKSENFRVNNTGIKVLRADANFLYTHKGNQLQKRSLTTFAIIASVTIPGGVMSTPFLSDNVTEHAGIDIDNCGNDRMALFKCSWELHNIVNQSLNKRQPSLQEALTYYNF